ncbi:MAG: hypothetical protein AB7F35_23635 [Acetobacteraceae bacterium]
MKHVTSAVLASALLMGFGSAAWAQSATQGSNSSNMQRPAQGMSANQGSGGMSGSAASGSANSSMQASGAQNDANLQQQVRQDLEKAGFKNVQVMPRSFLVRAQDKQDRPVMMIINPDSVMSVTALETQKGGASGSASGNSGSTGGSQTR